MEAKIEFQSTLPQGERRVEVIQVGRNKNFNPRSRKGSDSALVTFSPLASDFNPRSRKGSDFKICGVSGRQSNFNPRSRKGSDGLRVICDFLLAISIHAPARGATDGILLRNNIHVEFQSTLPQGERRRNVAAGSLTGGISIHAPARGATFPEC